MTYKLFIDDERNPGDVTWMATTDYSGDLWIVARSMDAAKSVIEQFGMPKHISFDHDLGDDQPTGYEIAKWIAETVMDGNYSLPVDFTFSVHSKNPVGAKNITMYMHNFIKHMQSTV